MAMVTLTSAYNTNLSETLPFETKNSNKLGDASFSSFLGSSEGTFVRKLPVSGSGRYLSPKRANQMDQHHQMGKKKEDGEIGVFGAEKYFNGVSDAESPRITKIDAREYQYVKDGRVHLDPLKPKIHNGTPSVRSESSWNSQKALLQSFKRNPTQRQTKVHGKSFLSGLGCKCYCSDKESVDVDEHVGEISFKRSANSDLVQGSKTIKKAPIKQTSLEIRKLPEPRVKEDLFTFPTMESVVGIHPVKIPFQQGEEDDGRKSLEVFGSPVLGRRNKFLNLERRLKMLSWDANPRADESEVSATSKGNYNDTESDASSDLFEIESLKGKANPFLVRQASDATSGCVTPTRYAPSEASIEWSVVTASAADFSVMSDYEEIRSAKNAPSPIKTFSTTSNQKAQNDKEMQRRRYDSLLGCNSHKAVRVTGDVYRGNENAGFDPRMRRVSDSYVPAARFQAETKLASLDPRQRQTILPTGSFSRSHSPRSSQFLCIQ